MAGLHDGDKRQLLFTWLRTYARADVYLLTETHCTSQEDASKWLGEWAGFAHAYIDDDLKKRGWFALSDSPHTGGTAVLFSRKFQTKAKVLQVHRDPSPHGSWTSILISHNFTQVWLDSVYLPAPGAQRVHTITRWEQHNTQRESGQFTIAGGDYNNCVDNVLEDTSSETYSNVGGEALHAAYTELGMVDAWRSHPDTEDVPGYTRYGVGGGQFSD